MNNQVSGEEVRQFSRAEHDVLNAFVSEILKQLFRKPPPRIWHYTNGDALISILRERSIWATHLSCLNDSAELQYGADHLLSATKKRLVDGNLSQESEWWLKLIVQNEGHNQKLVTPWFVSCFSECDDDLSQWRAYGGGEGGYALGFDPLKLSLLGLADSSFLAFVDYDTEKHFEIARKIVQFQLELFESGHSIRKELTREEWAKVFANAWDFHIKVLAPIFKHRGFREEKEWRVVREIRSDEFEKLVFKQKQSVLSRHLPLQFQDAQTSKNIDLPIVAIKVGPSRHKEVSVISVEAFLKAQGYGDDITVSFSDIPFQIL